MDRSAGCRRHRNKHRRHGSDWLYRMDGTCGNSHEYGCHGSDWLHRVDRSAWHRNKYRRNGPNRSNRIHRPNRFYGSYR